MDKGMVEFFRVVRNYYSDEDIDEIVRWQMTGAINHKTPSATGVSSWQTCRGCGREWHGLSRDGCPGSFTDTEK